MSATARSHVLAAAARLLLPLMLLFSLHLLLRDSDEPGGGFVGGFVASAALILHALAHGTSETKRRLRVEPRVLLATGLAVVLLSTSLSLVLGEPFMTAAWLPWTTSGTASLGTPLMFDAGIWLVIVGTTLSVLLRLEED